jgi:hypothetical protein
VARPSIVPIALTLDDRTGYTLWAPPWEEDGEEWQAFLGTTEDDTARVHLFPSPAALAAFCRTATDHDLADHPVWPVVVGLGAADLTPDDDHRYDLDGVYDLAAEDPDRWTVEELAATVDMVGRLAECLDTTDDEDDSDASDEDDDDEEFASIAELAAKPEIGMLALGPQAYTGRSGEAAWAGVGRTFDELWEDVVAELDEHLDWTGGGTTTLDDYPAAAEADGEEDDEGDVEDGNDDLDVEVDVDEDDQRPARATSRVPAGSTAAAPGVDAGVSTIRGGGRLAASPAAVAAAAEFWESVGILPVEIVVPDGAGLTLRCYVDDEARFLGRDGEVFLFDTPADLARFCAGRERHDLVEIASWPEVADTDTLPLPVDEDRYDLTELTEVLTEVVDGAPGLVDHRVFAQPVEGVRDIAEYADLRRVDELLSPGSALARAVARGEREPALPLRVEDAAELRREWDEVVAAVSSALVFRD